MSQLRVADLFQLHPLKNARLVCGEGGINRFITGVNIIEAPDVADWVQEGDVLLTNLYSIDKLRPLATFIQNVASKKLSALIIKTGLFVKEIPTEIIDTATDYSLPVIEITKDILYRDIAISISEHLLSSKLQLLERFKEMNRHFTKISLENSSFYRIMNSLEILVENPVALYDKNFQCLFSTDNSLKRFVVLKAFDEEIPYFIQDVNFPDYDDNIYKQCVFPIIVGNDIKTYLIVNKINKELEEYQFIAIESAINALSLDFIKQRAVVEVERQFRSDLVSDLLSGRTLSIEDIHRRASLLQWDLRKTYAVVVLRIVSREAKEKSVYKIDKSLYEKLQETFTIFLAVANTPILVLDDRMVILWEVSPSDKGWEARLKKMLASVQSEWSVKLEKLSLQGGFGGKAATIPELARSYREALDALDIKERIDFEDDFIAFSDVGIFRLLCRFPERSELDDFIPAALRNLLSVKTSIRDELLKTLYVYFRHNYNIIETARELNVHYKTVSYRIDKIKSITGIGFDNYEEMLLVQIGLKILKLTNKNITYM